MMTITITIDKVPHGEGAHVHVAGRGIAEDVFQTLYSEAIKQALTYTLKKTSQLIEDSFPGVARHKITEGEEARAMDESLRVARGQPADPNQPSGN